MNAKERMLRVLNHQPTDCYPVAPVYFSLYLDPHVRELYGQAYRDRMQENARRDVDRQEEIEIRISSVIGAYDKLEDWPDWMEVEIGPSRDWAANRVLEMEGGELFHRDLTAGIRRPLRGGIYEFFRDFGDGSDEVSVGDVVDRSGDFRSVADAEAAVEIIPFQALDEAGHFDLPRRVVERYGDDTFLYTIVNAPYWATYRLLGFEGMMTMIYDRPDVLVRLMERRMERTMERLEGFRRMGVPGVFLEEPFTSADLMSPRMYRELIFPHTQTMAQEIRRMGFKIVMYFPGNVIPLLPIVKELEIDALSVEASRKGYQVDLAQVVEGIGRDKCVFGNVDSIYVAQQGTQRDLEAEIKRQFEIGSAAAGFALSADSPFPLETPLERVDEFIAMGRKYGCGNAKGKDI